EQSDEAADEDRPGARETLPRQLAKGLTGGERGAVANLLYRGRQRQRQRGRPEQPETEGRSGLAIGRKPGRVVVGCARDQAGPERAKIATPRRSTCAARSLAAPLPIGTLTPVRSCYHECRPPVSISLNFPSTGTRNRI